MKSVEYLEEPSNQKNSFSPLHSYLTETWPVSELKTDPTHPRNTLKRQAEKAAQFIHTVSFVPPIIIDRKGHILVGQEWHEAAKILGLETVHVLVIDTLTEPQLRALRIAYVRITEDGRWDHEKLATEFKYLIEAGLSCDFQFKVDITGFEIGEIDTILSSTGNTLPDEIDDALRLQNIAITKPGDIWILGNHKIGCCDSLSPDAYHAILEKERIQLVCTDPPYNVKIPGFVSGNGVVQHENFAMASGEMSAPQFIEFLRQSITNAVHHLEDGGCFYVCIDWRHVEELIIAARESGLTLLNMCVWDKGIGMMGTFYRSQHELILVFRKGSKKHRNNIQLGKYGRNRTNVWSYPPANMSKEGREALKDHPTPKPVSLIADIILDVTRPHDIVLDPFLGGGTSIIAAEKTTRRCYGMELDPHYVDATIRRWQKFTGQSAIHADTGKTFEDQEQNNE